MEKRLEGPAGLFVSAGRSTGASGAPQDEDGQAKPMVAESEEALEREAPDHYRVIQRSELSPACKATLLEVFVNWVGQRLKHKGRKEIEAMFLGELPDLEETQLGKDLIHIGEQRGLEKGLEKAILVFLTARHGTVPPMIQEKIGALTATEAEHLLQHLPQCQTLDELAQWLDAHPA